MLAAPSRVYAVVANARGGYRQVYPETGDAVAPAGSVSFDFAVLGRMDPETGGRFTLRVFVVSESAPGGTPPTTDAGTARWEWLRAVSQFEDLSYEVQ
jgi:hypothetical protein